MKAEKHLSYNGARIDLLNMYQKEYKGKCVLDFGCYRGANASYLKSQFEGVQYIGFESDSVAINSAFREVDEIILADLDSFDFSVLGKYKVDVIILGDIIEHLKNPKQFMVGIAESIPENAEILISVPNIQYYETFFQLLMGNFPRRDRGVFDRTHLRWFTYREVDRMLCKYFKIEAYKRVYRLVDGNRFGFLNRLNFVFKPIFMIFAPFFTYQMMFRVKKLKL